MVKVKHIAPRKMIKEIGKMEIKQDKEQIDNIKKNNNKHKSIKSWSQTTVLNAK